MGSITIDEALLQASGIKPNEKVQIVNNNNGNRFETYVITGAKNSGVICLTWYPLPVVQPGDKVIIIAYAMMTEDEAESFAPRVVMVDADNKIAELRHVELQGELHK